MFCVSFAGLGFVTADLDNNTDYMPLNLSSSTSLLYAPSPHDCPVCLLLDVRHLAPLPSPGRHRRRPGWNSGGRMASAEGGSVPSGVGYGEGCPILNRLGGLGKRRELPQRG